MRRLAKPDPLGVRMLRVRCLVICPTITPSCQATSSLDSGKLERNWRPNCGQQVAGAEGGPFDVTTPRRRIIGARD